MPPSTVHWRLGRLLRGPTGRAAHQSAVFEGIKIDQRLCVSVIIDLADLDQLIMLSDLGPAEATFVPPEQSSPRILRHS
jgi:hypothetical protein